MSAHFSKPTFGPGVQGVLMPSGTNLTRKGRGLELYRSLVCKRPPHIKDHVRAPVVTARQRRLPHRADDNKANFGSVGDEAQCPDIEIPSTRIATCL